MTCVILSISTIFAALVFALNSTGDQTDSSEGEEVVPIDNSYRFRIYALNQTERRVDENGTFFAFNEEDFPYRTGMVRFGDYRNDAQFSYVYLSGSGILMTAVGGRCTVSVRGAGGSPIIEFDYMGQDLVALAGEECYSSCNERLTHSGTNILVSDWLTGAWTPRQGIVVDHPGNISFGNATLYVMVFEPAGATAIPEFDSFEMLVVVNVFVVLGFFVFCDFLDCNVFLFG